MSEGCPLLESVRVDQINVMDDHMTMYIGFGPLDLSAYKNIDFRPCFERCPKLKHVALPLCSDEQIKALVQHCPLVEEVRYQPLFLVHLLISSIPSHTHPRTYSLTPPPPL